MTARFEENSTDPLASDMAAVDAFAEPHAEVLQRYPGLGERRTVYEVIRRMTTPLTTSWKPLRQNSQPGAFERIMMPAGIPLPWCAFPIPTRRRRPSSSASCTLACTATAGSAAWPSRRSECLPKHSGPLWKIGVVLPEQPRKRLDAALTERARGRVVADYIARMPDRVAITEHQPLFDPSVSV